jgi:hypothetical protein
VTAKPKCSSTKRCVRRLSSWSSAMSTMHGERRRVGRSNGEETRALMLAAPSTHAPPWSAEDDVAPPGAVAA